MTLLRPPVLNRNKLRPSPLKSTAATDEDVAYRSDGGGGTHFLPSRPMDRARASCMLYSTPSSVNNRLILNRSFSGRFPGAGGASINAYLEAAVELKTPGDVVVVGVGSDRAGLVLVLLLEDPTFDDEDDDAVAVSEGREDDEPLF